MVKMKKTNNKFLIYFGIILLVIIIGGYFAITSNTSKIDIMSVISSQEETTIFEEISCQEKTDCYDAILDYGFPKNELDLQLEDNELFCESNVCGVIAK